MELSVNHDGAEDRKHWLAIAERLARPVLEALASQTLRATMPVEVRDQATAADRRKFTHLEAFGRLLSGLSPWLEAKADPAAAELAPLAQAALSVAVDPSSPDHLEFCHGDQALVDAAFLAQAILRAPDLLWHSLDDRTRKNLVREMKSTRQIKPPQCNWLLFSATVEAFLAMAGEDWDAMRVDYAVQQHMQWYKGDGAYGDGPNFHWDYYNSFVIHPMLIDTLAEAAKHRADWNRISEAVHRRTGRYAVVLERLVAPDGSFPPIGRSLTYRCGAFHSLSQLAWMKKLPAELKPAQVCAALTAVIGRTLEAPGTFDEACWLRLGLCGSQPNLAEGYISTGSLYLASAALLPLGLGAADEFWSASPELYTSQKIWSGQDANADYAMTD